MRPTFFTLLLLPSYLYAQDTPATFLRGSLQDRSTKAPIEFVSVCITNSLLGTAADENGTFTIKIENQLKKERLKISCIGYLTKTFSIDSLLALKADVVTLHLEPEVGILDEVVIKSAPISPAEIITTAVKSVSQNYFQGPFNLELFSTIDANDSMTGKPFKVETVMLGHYQGYNSSGKKKFEILQKRTTGDNPLKSVNYGYWPSFEMISADLLTDPNRRGVLNLDLLGDFKFKYAGVSVYESDTVYQIEYNCPKPTTKITGYGTVPKTYGGTIYITTGTNAVVRHEIITSSFRYHVIYKKVNDKYFPFYFSGVRTNEFKLPGGKRTFRTKNVITVSKIILDNVNAIDPKANEYDIHKVSYDEKFWNANYPVKVK